MPKAVRRHAKPDAPSPPEGKRAAHAVGTKELLDRMRTSAPPGGDLMNRADFRSRVIDWHSSLAQISGTLVAAFVERQGMSLDAAKAVIIQLRLTADAMESHFK